LIAFSANFEFLVFIASLGPPWPLDMQILNIEILIFGGEGRGRDLRLWYGSKYGGLMRFGINVYALYKTLREKFLPRFTLRRRGGAVGRWGTMAYLGRLAELLEDTNGWMDGWMEYLTI